MSNLTPPPERELRPQHRQAIRAALLDGQPGTRRTPILAAAAVAAIVVAGLVIPQLGSGDRQQPAGPPTTNPATNPTPANPTTDPTTASPRRTVASTESWAGRTPSDRAMPAITRHPAKDPVLICRDEIRRSLEPAQWPGDLRVAVRQDGRWGVALVLTDGSRWIGCDTTRYAYSGEASLLETRRVSPPRVGDADAYAVSNVAVDEPAGATLRPGGPIHDHYFAAGVLPRGVANLRYLFPDGVAVTAKVVGQFWLVEHLESAPLRPGRSSADRNRITVELLAADGSVIRRHRLAWGTQTCAHVNHGC
jgi:hypothetical protein